MRRKKKRLQPRCIQDSLWLELCRSFWSTKVKRYHLTRQRQEMLQSSAVTWWVSRVSRVFVFFVGGGGREILYIFFCLRVAVFIFVFWICKFSGFLFFVLILHIYIYTHNFSSFSVVLFVGFFCFDSPGVVFVTMERCVLFFSAPKIFRKNLSILVSEVSWKELYRRGGDLKISICTPPKFTPWNLFRQWWFPSSELFFFLDSILAFGSHQVKHLKFNFRDLMWGITKSRKDVGP